MARRRAHRRAVLPMGVDSFAIGEAAAGCNCTCTSSGIMCGGHSIPVSLTYTMLIGGTTVSTGSLTYSSSCSTVATSLGAALPIWCSSCFLVVHLPTLDSYVQVGFACTGVGLSPFQMVTFGADGTCTSVNTAPQFNLSSVTYSPLHATWTGSFGGGSYTFYADE
jgi:hypothetical protein